MDSILGKWAGANKDWYTFRASVAEDAYTGWALGVYPTYWKLTKWW